MFSMYKLTFWWSYRTSDPPPPPPPPPEQLQLMLLQYDLHVAVIIVSDLW